MYHYKDNSLFCEDTEISDLVNTYGTPLYVYSKNILKDNYARISNAFSHLGAKVCFSVKSNSNISILNILYKEGAYFDIVSGGELFRLLNIGVKGDRIIFSGVGKTESEIRKGIKANILYFNIESEDELNLINKIAIDLNMHVNITIRVNPNVDAGTHKHITTGTQENKFGLSVGQAYNIALKTADLYGITLDGFHCHIGSQITSTTPYLKAVKNLIRLSNKLKNKIPIKSINIGGGFGVPYGNENTPIPDISEFSNQLEPLLLNNDLQLFIEPGRYISATSGILLSELLYIKKSRNKNFAIIDAGMNDLMRPALYNSFHKITTVSKKIDSEEICIYDIVGPVCESSDCFGKNRKLKKLTKGDYIVIMNAGAYCASLSNNYNSRLKPAEVLVSRNNHALIRKKETIDDILSMERIVDL